MEILSKEEMKQIRGGEGGVWIYIESEEKWIWLEGEEGIPEFPPQPAEEKESSKLIIKS